MALLFVIEQPEMTHRLGVMDTFVTSSIRRPGTSFVFAHGLSRTEASKTSAHEEIIGEGYMAEEIAKLIEEDRDFGILVLGASTDPEGPGPLVSSLAAGAKAGSFPIPVTIVPGNLTIEEIQGLA